MTNSTTPDTIAPEFQAFISTFKSVILATVSADGQPESSYAPYLYQNGCFYIYISELAAHTRNLQTASDTPSRASLMFIESEQNTRNIFARKRATINVTAHVVPRHSDTWQHSLDRMAERFGDMISVIRTLNDFHLLELTPHSANYVTGFAKAYRLEEEALKLILPEETTPSSETSIIT